MFVILARAALAITQRPGAGTRDWAERGSGPGCGYVPEAQSRRSQGRSLRGTASLPPVLPGGSHPAAGVGALRLSSAGRNIRAHSCRRTLRTPTPTRTDGAKWQRIDGSEPEQHVCCGSIRASGRGMVACPLIGRENAVWRSKSVMQSKTFVLHHPAPDGPELRPVAGKDR